LDCSVSGFADVFDVDYFIEQTRGYVEVVKDLPAEIASKEPFKVDCSKRKGHFDYVESVLPALLEHQYISLTPAMNQRRDRYYSFIYLLDPLHFLSISIILLLLLMITSNSFHNLGFA
jgi:hypothetical protein